MNLRKRDDIASVKNKVIIKNTGPMYINIIKKDHKRYEFPDLIYKNRLNIAKKHYEGALIGKTATATHIFKHKDSHYLFVCRLETGPCAGKYIVIGSTGFKKKSKLWLNISNFNKGE